MKISFNKTFFPNFGIYVSPKMKYNIFKETKKFYNRKDAEDLLSLIESGSDKFKLEDFRMSVPNKRKKSIFCDLFITSKAKNGKNCLIHTFLGKLKDKSIQYYPLEKIIKNI